MIWNESMQKKVFSCETFFTCTKYFLFFYLANEQVELLLFFQAWMNNWLNQSRSKSCVDVKLRPNKPSFDQYIKQLVGNYTFKLPEKKAGWICTLSKYQMPISC